MTESMKNLREACVERGSWIPYDAFYRSECIKLRLVINELQALLSAASGCEVTDVFYNVVELDGSRLEYVSVYDDHKMLAFVDVTGDSPMALVRDLMRGLEDL